MQEHDFKKKKYLVMIKKPIGRFLNLVKMFSICKISQIVFKAKYVGVAGHLK